MVQEANPPRRSIPVSAGLASRGQLYGLEPCAKSERNQEVAISGVKKE